MKSIIPKNILLSTFLLVGSTGSLFAEAPLPVSTQTTKKEKLELVPEIKIQVQAQGATTNPKLKQGDACADEDLEEAEGEVFTEIPMAKTIPCNEVDCQDLQPAKVQKDNYKKLNIAKTVNCDK